MKTRLDEIVEEEGRRWIELMRPAPWTGDQVVVAERIAERAFRHGAEMGGMAAISHCEQIRLDKAPPEFGYTVQPAPAEEKKHRCLCGPTYGHATPVECRRAMQSYSR